MQGKRDNVLDVPKKWRCATTGYLWQTNVDGGTVLLVKSHNLKSQKENQPNIPITYPLFVVEGRNETVPLHRDFPTVYKSRTDS